MKTAAPKYLGGMLAVCASLSSIEAAGESHRSEDPSPEPPAPLQAVVSLGGGAFAASGNGAAALVRLQIEADVPPNRDPPVTSLCPRTRHGLGVTCGVDQHLYGRLDAVGAFSANRQGPSVAYGDLRFFPKENQIYAPVPSETDNALVAELQFAPFQLGRDVTIGESLKIVVSAAAAAATYWVPLGANLALFLQYALDLLGYKAVRSISGTDPFDGVHLAGSDAHLGIGWIPTSDLTIRIFLGNRIDYNQWTRGQSDTAFTGTVTADVGRFLRFFAQPQVVYAWDGARGWTGNGEFMGGVDVVFF